MADSITLLASQRVMAPLIIYKGAEYRLSVAGIIGEEVVITPYAEEVHSTVFVNGTIEVEHSPEGLKVRRK